MRRPEVREQILGEVDEFTGGLGSMMGAMLGGVVGRLFSLAFPVDYEPDPSQSVKALARAQGVEPLEYLYDKMTEGDGGAFFALLGNNFNAGTLEPCREMLLDEHSVSGLSDAGAHVTMISDCSSSTFHLTHWVRDRTKGERVPLELAVRKLTGAPAEMYGFDDRGVIGVGRRADLNVIDFDNLTIQAPYLRADLPTGAEPHPPAVHRVPRHDRGRRAGPPRRRGHRRPPGRAHPQPPGRPLMDGLNVVVVGAGIGGLASALALARTGNRVTLIERDDHPMPADPEAAFEWNRTGAPQVRHPHVFLGLARTILRDRFPDVPAGALGPRHRTRADPQQPELHARRGDARGAPGRRRPAHAPVPAHHLRVGDAPHGPRRSRDRPRARPGRQRRGAAAERRRAADGHRGPARGRRGAPRRPGGRHHRPARRRARVARRARHHRHRDLQRRGRRLPLPVLPLGSRRGVRLPRRLRCRAHRRRDRRRRRDLLHHRGRRPPRQGAPRRTSWTRVASTRPCACSPSSRTWPRPTARRSTRSTA